MLTRTTKVAEIKYHERVIFTQPWGPDKSIVYNDTAEMVSTNHSGWRTSNGDAGGAFYLRKVTNQIYPGTHKSGLFEGGFVCGAPTGFTRPWQPYVSPSNSSLDAKGTTAIARVEPTKSVADVATFIGELRTDGLPRLRPDTMRATTKRARAAGSDYLNVEFGWRPFVSDLQKFARAVVDSHEILENYHSHGNGQKLRRRYAFPTQSESWSANATNFLPQPANSQIGFGQGSHFLSRQQDMWFSGAFRYHIPFGSTALDKFRTFRSDAQKLFGVDITPETVWNVSPWSWLVDWQSNTGDVLHNISAMGRDGLVLQYGYMMCHSSFEESRCAKFAQSYASSSIKEDIKVRRPATPYGFGVDIAGLTARQSAILVALGLSRT